MAMIDVRSQFPITPGWPRLNMDWYHVDGIVIHHTAVDPRTGEGEALLLPAAAMTQADELNHIRIIHLYHKSIGFGGFGYHFIAFPSGRVYYVVDLHRWGAHVYSYNNSKFGVCAAGNFVSIPPGPTQYKGIWGAIWHIGFTVPLKTLPITPHNQWTDTTCPGKAWPLPEKEEPMSDLTLEPLRFYDPDTKVGYDVPKQTYSIEEWIKKNRYAAAYALFAARVYKKGLEMQGGTNLNLDEIASGLTVERSP